MSKRWIKSALQWFVRRLVQITGSVTMSQLQVHENISAMEIQAHDLKSIQLQANKITSEQVQVSDQITAPHLQTSSIITQHIHVDRISSAQSEQIDLTQLPTMEAKIRQLTNQVDELRQTVHYLLLPDSEGHQKSQNLIPDSALTVPHQISLASDDHQSSQPDKLLRILHIGNIANNAYLASKILNEAGYDCDVFCYDYYHVMGSPEWEDADFVGDIDDAFGPDWGQIDLRGFQRPRWFAQGPFDACINYLSSRRTGQFAEAAFWWHKLMIRQPISDQPADEVDLENFLSNFDFIAEASEISQLMADLEATFVGAYQSHLARLKMLLTKYDIIQAYGSNPFLPALVGKRPIVAFEHGTIRKIPFENTPLGRLTALGYKHADGVVITNADNVKAAERLQLLNYRFIPHPVNEKWIIEGIGSELRTRLLQELQVDFLIFHPARQHWSAERDPNYEKGNDIFIRGLARFIHEVAPTSGAVFVEWGQSVPDSTALLAELGIADRVRWAPLLHNCNMSRYMDASDIIADQFYLGAFGNIMPKALAHGKPSILYLDEAAHNWCLPEMPPVINAHTPEEVFLGLKKAYEDRDWLANLAREGRGWYEKYHSNAAICDQFEHFYKDILNLSPSS